MGSQPIREQVATILCDRAPGASSSGQRDGDPCRDGGQVGQNKGRRACASRPIRGGGGGSG